MTTVLGALAAAAGLAIVVWGLSPALGRIFAGGVVDDRILAYGIEARRANLASPDEPGFGERMVRPLLDRLRNFVGRNTPEASVAAIQAKLTLAGSPNGISALDFLVMRTAGAALGITVGVIAGAPSGNPGLALVGGSLLGVVLWVLPVLWLDRSVAAQRKAIAVALPNVIDFLAVCVDAGLTFDSALGRVIERYPNALTAGLEQATAEVRLGRDRAEALEAYARSTGIDSVRSFVGALVQGERMGVPVSRTLRAQADELRWRRRQEARELGASASVKMLIPMILFILPTVWIILLGPALIRVLTAGL